MKSITMKMLLVAVGLMGSVSVWADDEYTSVYSRSVTEWTTDDVSSTEWVATNVTPTISTETGGGICCTGAPSGGYTVTKTFTIADNAKVKYEGVWTVNRVTGRDANYCYIQFGDKIRISVPNGGTFYLNTDGASSPTTTTGVSTTVKNAVSYNYSIIINTATSTVESFTFGGKDLTSLVSGTISGNFNSFTIGYARSGSGSSTNNLTSIAVSQCTQDVTNADYTINYKEGDNVVKTVSSTSVVDDVITAATAIDGEGDYAGNHYLITAASAPSMTLVDGTNVLNVPVRAPYTATLSITTTINGSSNTESSTLTETDDKDCSWTYAYPMYEKSDGVYYACDATSYVISGTFGDGETVARTITYSTADETIMSFSEVGTGGTNSIYSGGTYAAINTKMASCTLDKGGYQAEIYIVSRAGNGSHTRNENLVVDGSTVATTTSDTYGLQTLLFTVESDDTEVYVQGAGASNYADNLDYVLIRKINNVSATIGTTGYTTFASDYALDLDNISGATAYYASAVGTGTVTLTEATGTVEAGTPLILYVENGGTATIPVVASGDAISSNLLVRGTGESVGTNANCYVLVANNGTAEFQSLASQAATVATDKAYLNATAAGAKLRIVFEGESTGIEAIEATESVNSGVIYNLAGQRVAAPTKGIYIKNGKKILVK